MLQYKPLSKLAEATGSLAIMDSFIGMMKVAKDAVEDHLQTYQVTYKILKKSEPFLAQYKRCCILAY